MEEKSKIDEDKSREQSYNFKHLYNVKLVFISEWYKIVYVEVEVRTPIFHPGRQHLAFFFSLLGKHKTSPSSIIKYSSQIIEQTERFVLEYNIAKTIDFTVFQSETFTKRNLCQFFLFPCDRNLYSIPHHSLTPFLCQYCLKLIYWEIYQRNSVWLESTMASVTPSLLTMNENCLP